MLDILLHVLPVLYFLMPMLDLLQLYYSCTHGAATAMLSGGRLARLLVGGQRQPARQTDSASQRQRDSAAPSSQQPPAGRPSQQVPPPQHCQVARTPDEPLHQKASGMPTQPFAR